MAEIESKPSGNKLVAILLFLVLGMVFNTFLNYAQTRGLQSTTEERAVVGNEILELNRDQSAQIKILIEKIDNLNIKVENLEKAGKSGR